MMSLPMKWICSVAGIGHEVVEDARLAVRLRAALVEVVLQRGEVADRRVEPDVEVLARRVGDLDAEVGRVAADVPVGEAAVAVLVDLEPLADLVQHLGLQRGPGSCVQAFRNSRQRWDESWKK